MKLYAVISINKDGGFAFADPASDVITAPDGKKYYTDTAGKRCRLYDSVVVADPVVLSDTMRSGFVKIAWPAVVHEGPETVIDRTYTICLDGHNYALGMDVFAGTVFSLEDGGHVSGIRSVADRNAAIRSVCKPHDHVTAYNIAHSARCYGGALYSMEH